MIWVDYAILGIVAVSGVIGLVRGLIREVLSLVVWGLAVWVGLSHAKGLAVYFEGSIEVPSLRLAAAFAILFFATVLLGSLVSYLIGQLVVRTGLGGTDRLLGLVFGLVRGSILVAVLVFAAGLTPLPEDPWWQRSQLIPPFQRLSLWLKGRLPEGIAGHIDFDAVGGGG